MIRTDWGRWVAPASVLIACAVRPEVSYEETAVRSDTARSGQSAPSAPCGLDLAPEESLARATRVAAERWSAATGCDIRVDPGGVQVAMVEQPRLADGTPKRAVTIVSDAGVPVRIEYRRRDFVEHTAEVLLAHEVAHALGMREHTASGIGAERVTLDATIDTATLEAVCAVLACASFVPEVRAAATQQRQASPGSTQR